MIQNEVTKAIADRRSIRAYKPGQITEEELETLLECGFLAPSGGNGQQWFLSVVQKACVLDDLTEKVYAWRMANAKSQEEIDRINSRPKSISLGAPTVIFCAYPAGDGGVNVSFLAENVVLAAQSIGLGTLFLGGIMAYMKGTEEGRAWVDANLQLPEGYELAYGIAVGYPDEAPAARPRERKMVRI